MSYIVQIKKQKRRELKTTTATCGFMAVFHEEIANATNVPIFLWVYYKFLK